jgi:HNH endonuclease
VSRPTAADARSRLSYDPDTGALTRLAFTDTRGKFHRERPVRMTPRRNGYNQVSLLGYPYLVHRVIYLIVTGRWPKHDIDHINGNPADNRWSNIRPATRSQNSANKGRDPVNTSGYKGVHLCGFTGLWRARIKFKGKSTCLGRFTSPEAAHAAYAKAARRIYGAYARAE